MSLRPFTYCPDDYFDCGDLGEHPIKFIAWIEFLDEQTRPNIRITFASVSIKYEGAPSQTVDIFPRLKKDPEEMRKWEDEILRDWESIRCHNDDPDYEEGA
jgi:hypothetical protein